MEIDPKYHCPVCGFFGLVDLPKSENGYSFEICSCCGFHFGYHDFSKDETYESYRQKWIIKGFPFFHEKFEPKNWSAEILKTQLDRIGVKD